MKQYSQIKELAESIESDFEKFYKNGSEDAGARIRSGIQEIKQLAEEIGVSGISNHTGPRDRMSNV